MHTRSVTMGWPKANHQENQASGFGNMLAVSVRQDEPVITGQYGNEAGNALSLSPMKRVAFQRKTWSTTECKQLRKWREEGQSFSDLSTVRISLIVSNHEAVPFIDISVVLWRVGFRRDPAILQGETSG